MTPTGKPSEAPIPGAQIAVVAPRVHAFSSLYGDMVVDQRGESLGTLDELLLDLSRGRIAYAVVSSGGFMGRGERVCVVPWAAVARDADRHRFVVACDKPSFDAAPAFDKAQLLRGFDMQWHLALHRYYRCRPYWI